MRRFTGHKDQKWGSFLDIKINAAEVLGKQRFSKKKKGTILIGSVTDAYQAMERKCGLTRKILEILVNQSFSISILTKSSLVTRDIDLFERMENIEVGMTLTSLDDHASKIFEPGASPPKERIEALAFLKKSGIKTYAFIGPILPGVTDLRKILEELRDKVDFVMFESLNLSKANQVETAGAFAQLQLNCPDGSFDWDEVEKTARRISSELAIPVKGFYRH
jgi:DNA repair photolyase